ncbi:MAG: glycosyltransferase family 9 protein [Candidatus Latescibacterota bacterium]|nr:MAG: glycosyltransferase family 9 protein [Candidatus Latescibacterota bacterium]
MRITIIRFSALGDCILLCPFISHLKTHGASQVSVITKRSYMELFAAAHGVDRVIALDREAGIRGLAQIIRAHRGEDSVVIDAHASTRSHLLSIGLGGAAARIGKYYTEKLGLILFKRMRTIPSVTRRYSALGKALDFPPMGANPWLDDDGSMLEVFDIPEGARVKIDSYLRGIDKPIVAMAPGSRWPMKRWGIEKYAELARRITMTHDCHVVLLGDETEARWAEPVAASLGRRGTNLVGRASIMETAAAIQQATAFVGNDSGLMHLSEAVGVPVIALFGPTVKAFGYYPSLDASKVIERDISCRPCSRNGGRPCPKKTQECLTAIPVELVEEAFSDLFAGRGPARYVQN